MGGMNRADNMALMQVLSRIRDAQAGFQGLTFAGELGEALRMIRNPAQSLRHRLAMHYDRVKKSAHRSKSNAKEIRERAAGAWLESVFGWRPLLSDIDSGVEELARVMTYTPDRVAVRGKGKDLRNLQEGSASTLEWGPLKLKRGPLITSYLNEVRYYGAIGMESKDISAVASRFGVSWSEVAPTIWELIPYSFLIDYFTNVGDIINACAVNRAGIKWMAKGTLREATRKRAYLVPETFIYKTSTERTSSSSFRPGRPGSSTVRSISRTAVSELGIPTLEFTVPGMSTKWINIAALLSSQKDDRIFMNKRYRYARA